LPSWKKFSEILANWKSAKSCVIYFTKKQKLPRSVALVSAQIVPKICKGPAANNVLKSARKIRPNRFTSGRVIAERVNTVQTCDKVFPILGEAIASR